MIDKRETGIEPATPGLGSRCSTIELLAHDPRYQVLLVTITRFAFAVSIMLKR